MSAFRGGVGVLVLEGLTLVDLEQVVTDARAKGAPDDALVGTSDDRLHGITVQW